MPQFQPTGSPRHAGGRPKGSRNKKTLAHVAGIESGDDISMLEILCRSARLFWEEGDRYAAIATAEKAAPYLHPRLSAVDVHASMSADPRQLTDEAICRLLMASGVIEAPMLEHERDGARSGRSTAYAENPPENEVENPSVRAVSA